MARGWESKAIEAQQADADSSGQPRGPRLTLEQQALRRQIEGLQLSRKNILRQLEGVTNPLRRRMLEQSLVDLDQKVRDLSESR